MSFSANAIEALVFVVMLAYSARSGFPFSTYGETALIAGQDVVISGLVLWFGGQGGAGVVGAWVVGVGSLAVGLMSGGVVGMDALRRLQVGAGMVGLVGKMPQIWQIWREGGTGVLSAFAVSLRDCFTLLLWGFCWAFPDCWLGEEAVAWRKKQRGAEKMADGGIILQRRKYQADGTSTSCYLGIQLPPRLPRPRLHHLERSRRPPSPLQLPGGLCPEFGAGRTDGLLLE